jgi:hypothetical protein
VSWNIVERVHGVTFTPVAPAGSDDALQAQEETTARGEGLLRDVRQPNEARWSPQSAHSDTERAVGSAVGEGTGR